MHPSFITVIGNVGAGKTTFSKALAKKLRAKFIAADEFYLSNPFFQEAVKDRARWSLTSDLWFLYQRIEMVRAFAPLLKKKSIVQDSGVPMSWVYSNSRVQAGHMSQKEFQLYNTFFEDLVANIPSDGLIIFLNLPVSTLLNRITQRGREFEIQNYTARYLEQLQGSLHAFVRQARGEGINVIELNEGNWIDARKNSQHWSKLIALLETHP